jgi:hypothetical protein
VRHALGRILTQGILFALLGALLVETIATISARTLPSTPTHLIALGIALLMGYAAFVTVALRETVRGIVSSLESITAELEKLVSHTFHDAEALLHLSDSGAARQPAHGVQIPRQLIASSESSILLGDLLAGDHSDSHIPPPLVVSTAGSGESR